AVCLLSLAIAAKECSTLETGSNPIWYRTVARTKHQGRISLRGAAARWAGKISRDLHGSSKLRREGHRILNADFTLLEGASAHFDVCLTSPPYLNRLDYVVAHLPELSVLGLVTPIDLDQLRRQMIG